MTVAKETEVVHVLKSDTFLTGGTSARSWQRQNKRNHRWYREWFQKKYRLPVTEKNRSSSLTNFPHAYDFEENPFLKDAHFQNQNLINARHGNGGKNLPFSHQLKMHGHENSRNMYHQPRDAEVGEKYHHPQPSKDISQSAKSMLNASVSSSKQINFPGTFVRIHLSNL